MEYVIEVRQTKSGFWKACLRGFAGYQSIGKERTTAVNNLLELLSRSGNPAAKKFRIKQMKMPVIEVWHKHFGKPQASCRQWCWQAQLQSDNLFSASGPTKDLAIIFLLERLKGFNKSGNKEHYRILEIKK